MMNSAAISIQNALNYLSLHIITCFKVLLLSSFKTKLPKITKSELVVLGNGPSLREELKLIDSKEPIDFMAVNFFVNADEFTTLKPSHYLLCDPLFFKPYLDDRIEPFYKSLFSKTDWNLNLFIPFEFKKDFQKIIKNQNLTNSNIETFYFNKTNSNGNSSFIRSLYKKGLVIPSPTTVLIPCMMIGINAGYKSVSITGASHNYHENIKMDQSNTLMIKVPHFYENEELKYKPYKKPNSEETYTISEFYLVLHKMFGSYEFVSKFAESMGVQLFNYTKTSYIDQLEKK